MWRGGCCPNGQQPCGSSHCYDPATEQYCTDAERGCERDLTCCGQECCSRYARSSNGNCVPNTCTVTSTYTTTSTSTRVGAVTRIQEPEGEEEAPEFTCVPLTATDAAGDTLELGDDCRLTFQPADADADATIPTSISTVTPAPTPRMKPRAPQVRSTCACTRTVWVTSTMYTVATSTRTVTREEATESFSCPPMSVTNDIGDELILDEECQLAFSPGDSSAAVTTTANDVQLPGSSHSVGAATATNDVQLPIQSNKATSLQGASADAITLAMLLKTLLLICT